MHFIRKNSWKYQLSRFILSFNPFQVILVTFCFHQIFCILNPFFCRWFHTLQFVGNAQLPPFEFPHGMIRENFKFINIFQGLNKFSKLDQVIISVRGFPISDKYLAQAKIVLLVWLVTILCRSSLISLISRSTKSVTAIKRSNFSK